MSSPKIRPKDAPVVGRPVVGGLSLFSGPRGMRDSIAAGYDKSQITPDTKFAGSGALGWWAG